MSAKSIPYSELKKQRFEETMSKTQNKLYKVQGNNVSIVRNGVLHTVGTQKISIKYCKGVGLVFCNLVDGNIARKYVTLDLTVGRGVCETLAYLSNNQVESLLTQDIINKIELYEKDAIEILESVLKN